MRRGRRRALTLAVERCLERPLPPTTQRYLELLDRRLADLEAGHACRPSAADRALARRFLAPLEGRWDDGDEGLVRDQLDGWPARGEDASGQARTGLLRAARTLAALQVRPATLWFFLWEMESVLAALAPRGPRKGRG